MTPHEMKGCGKEFGKEYTKLRCGQYGDGGLYGEIILCPECKSKSNARNGQPSESYPLTKDRVGVTEQMGLQTPSERLSSSLTASEIRNGLQRRSNKIMLGDKFIPLSKHNEDLDKVTAYYMEETNQEIHKLNKKHTEEVEELRQRFLLVVKEAQAQEAKISSALDKAKQGCQVEYYKFIDDEDVHFICTVGSLCPKCQAVIKALEELK